MLNPDNININYCYNLLLMLIKYNFILRSNCKETVTSPGFSFRVAQTAREMRSTSSNKDPSNLSNSYTLE